MNRTTEDHFREYFPKEDVSGYDSLFFSRGSETACAFIAVKGKMEDFKVFTRGEYDEESLERRIFELVAAFGPKDVDRSVRDPWVCDDLLMDGGESVRMDMINETSKVMWGAVGKVVLMTLLVLAEAAAIWFMHLMNVEFRMLFVTAVAVLCADVTLVLAMRDKRVGVGGEFGE